MLLLCFFSLSVDNANKQVYVKHNLKLFKPLQPPKMSTVDTEASDAINEEAQNLLIESDDDELIVLSDDSEEEDVIPLGDDI